MERERSSEPGDRTTILRALVEKYSRPLSRYFNRRVSAPHDVPDLVQEVFLRLSRLTDPNDIRQRDSFIFVTAANVLKDQARRDQVRGAGLSDPIDDFSLEGSDFSPTASWKAGRSPMRCAVRWPNCPSARATCSCCGCWRD
ncbi:sigma factor [Sphingomonas sp. LR59]|uniref:RNA polymerase sigma factor n=1 Tax=Sphingomonas sp. LR59 TaxID=3050232 RepID=UPI002FE2681E